jgi:ABC-type transporter Mla subunit MlaD
MNLKLIVAILAIAAVPVGAQAQKPGAAKVANADAQKVVKIITGDKAMTQAFCELNKLGEQIDQAEQKNDSKTADALSQKADALAEKLGPEYAALMDGLQTLDQNSKDGDAIGKTLEDLDKLCAK